MASNYPPGVVESDFDIPDLDESECCPVCLTDGDAEPIWKHGVCVKHYDSLTDEQVAMHEHNERAWQEAAAAAAYDQLPFNAVFSEVPF